MRLNKVKATPCKCNGLHEYDNQRKNEMTYLKLVTCESLLLRTTSDHGIHDNVVFAKPFLEDASLHEPSIHVSKSNNLGGSLRDDSHQGNSFVEFCGCIPFL